MSSIRVKWQIANAAADEYGACLREVSDVIASVRSVKSDRCMRGNHFTGVYGALDRAAADMENEKQAIRNLSDGLKNVLKCYQEYENRILNRTGGGTIESNMQAGNQDFVSTVTEILKGTVISVIWESIVKVLDAFGISGWEDIIGNGKKPAGGVQTQWPPAVNAPVQIPSSGGGAGYSGGGNVQGGGADGAPRYNLPEYALKNLDPDANGIYGPIVYWRNGRYGRVCEWNKVGQLSCTYYTLRKLNERGMSYPCTGGPGNGGQWYDNFDKESGLPHYAGNNALNDLAGSLALPQENIVVSFGGGEWGHVLLIDKMYRDENGVVKVIWSDMNHPGDITELNGTNPAREMTLAEFRRINSGAINGVAVLGAGHK